MFACLQPGKCLYTTVRELVENSLDAAESIGLLPDIDVEMCAAQPPLPAVAITKKLSPCCMGALCSDMHLLCLCSSEVAQTELNDIRGMVNLSRVDEALYQDHETEAEHKARLGYSDGNTRQGCKEQFARCRLASSSV